MPEKDIILFIQNIPPEALDGIRKYEKETNQKFRLAVLYDHKSALGEEAPRLERADIRIPCDTNNWLKIEEALLPYREEFLAVTCRGEGHIRLFEKIIPHVPYLRTPTEKSLIWATDKVSMRRKIRANDKTIVPKFTIVNRVDRESIEKIKEKVGFPLIIKPAGLAASLLVSICFHKEELETTLNKIFKKIDKLYKDNHRNFEPEVLVEQFMDGDMYSIDAYVTSRGRVFLCPLVHVKTGYTIGFDDFFGYRQITPSNLKKENIEKAERVAIKAIHAIGLRSCTAHIELMRVNDEWKIIELGPRVGGFRHRLYELAFGINHSANDILIRIPKTPIIPKKHIGHAVAMKFFAKEEGILSELKGIKKISQLASFVEIKINRKIGDKCIYAKNGGRSVFNLIMFNKDRSELLADIRRAEQTVGIKTVKSASQLEKIKI